ncbi:UDP-N-acetylmuramoyl-L-alanyl-D-glutamate--2,6-diaminopimelate ligase [Legionella sp. km772]|uniref:UDP-N-acetylmuramoyl-L-alanyl-D-glutamate--2, 6-diaminopimelate ligase n=1 Tax=Legionella sp. km772 TaxID=2498111 RepID=UPI000F8D0E6C|nr:UDP-N-acetylmuramoyl-L-alanyl-D-glutamate--2,6-diaminopimelate ligase [Legionella sp. km772]RUR11953.1 UDP-N-acetylmuramoyl-L-alanyl-D-glutamate--2,6-diaminopimelate ligase [Legionella sp. km772]
MKLTQLFEGWLNQNLNDCDIKDLKNDSRLVQKGDVFIAYPGAATDGRLFIKKAVDAGASAIVYEPDNFPASVSLPTTIPSIAIRDLAQHLATIAQIFFNNPSHSLRVTGVTGTNGKTTIAYQLAQAHSLLKRKAAYIGTIGQGEVDQLQLLENTTPDALCLQKLLHQYFASEIKEVCMEVSSHALSQHRVDGIEFKQAIFTNLSLDHLDYHHTMEAYAKAKAQLFVNKHLETIIVNNDDPYKDWMLKSVNSQVEVISYGMTPESDVYVAAWQSDMQGTSMELVSPWGAHQLIIKALGQFNIYNCLAIFSSLMTSGYPLDQVLTVMAQLKAAPGRMEIVAQSPYVLVDYAHTPDALENALTTLLPLKKGDLWVIFGCGGDRDKSKRPIMGKAASDYADKIVITSDNPRTEDPEQIIKEIVEGIPSSRQITRLIKREEAIAYALHHAKKEDIILIAGKGHEAYQQIGTKKYVFSDQDLVKELLKKL